MPRFNRDLVWMVGLLGLVAVGYALKPHPATSPVPQASPEIECSVVPVDDPCPQSLAMAVAHDVVEEDVRASYLLAEVRELQDHEVRERALVAVRLLRGQWHLVGASRRPDQPLESYWTEPKRHLPRDLDYFRRPPTWDEVMHFMHASGWRLGPDPGCHLLEPPQFNDDGWHALGLESAGIRSLATPDTGLSGRRWDGTQTGRGRTP